MLLVYSLYLSDEQFKSNMLAYFSVWHSLLFNYVSNHDTMQSAIGCTGENAVLTNQGQDNKGKFLIVQ